MNNDKECVFSLTRKTEAILKRFRGVEEVDCEVLKWVLKSPLAELIRLTR